LPRLWYPERFHVEVVCYKLAGRIFETEEWPLPAFEFLGAKGAGLLESALALPRQSFAGRYFYKTWDEKAGVLLRTIVKNHPLIDGNKRIGLATTVVFLLMNGRFLFVSNAEMVELALDIASPGEHPTWRQIGRWIRQRAVPINRFRGATNRMKERYPERAEELERIGEAIIQFGKWAREYRKLENEVRRDCKRLGIDPKEILPEIAASII
jgi:death-on-curing family protein